MSISTSPFLKKLNWTFEPGTTLHLLNGSIQNQMPHDILSKLIDNCLKEGMSPDQRFPLIHNVLDHQNPFYWESLLHKIINLRDLKLVEQLFEAGVNINGLESDGDNPLNQACRIRGGEKIALFLIEKGAIPQVGQNSIHPLQNIFSSLHALSPERILVIEKLMNTLENPNHFVESSSLFLSLPKWKKLDTPSFHKWTKQKNISKKVNPWEKAFLKCQNLKGAPLLKQLEKLGEEELFGGWPLRLKGFMEGKPQLQDWASQQSWKEKDLNWALMRDITLSLDIKENIKYNDSHFYFLIKRGANVHFKSPNGLNVFQSLIINSIEDIFFNEEDSQHFILDSNNHKIQTLIQAHCDGDEHHIGGFSALDILKMFKIKLKNEETQSNKTKFKL